MARAAEPPELPPIVARPSGSLVSFTLYGFSTIGNISDSTNSAYLPDIVSYKPDYPQGDITACYPRLPAWAITAGHASGVLREGHAGNQNGHELKCTHLCILPHGAAGACGRVDGIAWPEPPEATREGALRRFTLELIVDMAPRPPYNQANS
jgi:hypothetical protein